MLYINIIKIERSMWVKSSKVFFFFPRSKSGRYFMLLINQGQAILIQQVVSERAHFDQVLIIIV